MFLILKHVKIKIMPSAALVLPTIIRRITFLLYINI